jgi:hypothetical protein
VLRAQPLGCTGAVTATVAGVLALKGTAVLLANSGDAPTLSKPKLCTLEMGSAVALPVFARKLFTARMSE